MKNVLLSILQISIVLLLSPLVGGIIRKVKALVQHRKGAPIFQLYFDAIRLFRKDMVISTNASWVFKSAPYIYCITALLSSLFIPALPQLFSFGLFEDMITAVFLLALGRFFLALAALDTGSTFGGMGASRDLMISSLIEPSLIIAVFTLGFSMGEPSTKSSSIYFEALNKGWGIVNPVYLLLFMAVFIILIAETARIPVDDPSTHLELTMVHEAMLLEYSGRYLALIEIGAWTRQFVFISLLANVFLPFGVVFGSIEAFFISFGCFTLKVIVISLLIATFEVNTVKLRLFSVPNLAALAFILSLLSFMSGFIF